MGVQRTETSLIIWSGSSTGDQVEASSSADQQSQEPLQLVFDADRVFNAGDRGCAAGPLDEIASIIQEMSAGQTLEIYATDAAVSIDLGAWCRMTGNELVEQRGHNYLIRKS